MHSPQSPGFGVDKTALYADPLSIPALEQEAGVTEDVTNGTFSIEFQAQADTIPSLPSITETPSVPKPFSPVTAGSPLSRVRSPTVLSVTQHSSVARSPVLTPQTPSVRGVSDVPSSARHTGSPAAQRASPKPAEQTARAPDDVRSLLGQPVPPETPEEAALAPEQTYTAAEVRHLDMMYRREQQRAQELAAELRMVREELATASGGAGGCTADERAALEADLAEARRQAEEWEAEVAAVEKEYRARTQALARNTEELIVIVEELRTAGQEAERERDEALDRLAQLEAGHTAPMQRSTGRGVRSSLPTPPPGRSKGDARRAGPSARELSQAQQRAAAAEAAQTAAEAARETAEQAVQTAREHEAAAQRRAQDAERRANDAEQAVQNAKQRADRAEETAASRIADVEARCNPAAVERRLAEADEAHAAALAQLRAKFSEQLQAAHVTTLSMQDEQDKAVEATLHRSHEAALGQTRRIRGLIAANAELEQRVAALHLELDAERRRGPLKTVAEVQARLHELEERAKLSVPQRLAAAEAAAEAAEIRAKKAEKALTERTAQLQGVRNDTDALIAQISSLMASVDAADAK